MIYLERFLLPSDQDELQYKLTLRPELDYSCFSGSGYPFGIFPQRKFEAIDFTSPVTIFCGENGSGKSTLLNVIAEKLELSRSTSFNKSPCFDAYVGMCRAEFNVPLPRSGCAIVTSDSVFDFLLDTRAINEGIASSRQAIFDSFYEQKKTIQDNGYQLKSLDDYEELKKVNEIRRTNAAKYAARRASVDIVMNSNGESALDIFESAIKEKALYLLDEPENSLSATHQRELARYISDSARFYNCQFIISSHSPFILSMREAVVYDLDAYPVGTRRWSELPAVKEYYGLFKDREDDFE